MSNPWVESHEHWYRHATPAERAAFDASRSCSAKKVFKVAMFPTREAWGLFLSSMKMADERTAGTPLPDRIEVKGKVRVYDAMQTMEKAIVGVAGCSSVGCTFEGIGVASYRMTGNGVTTEAHLCPECARWRRIDPMYGIETIELVAIP